MLNRFYFRNLFFKHVVCFNVLSFHDNVGDKVFRIKLVVYFSKSILSKIMPTVGDQELPNTAKNLNITLQQLNQLKKFEIENRVLLLVALIIFVIFQPIS